MRRFLSPGGLSQRRHSSARTPPRGPFAAAPQTAPPAAIERPSSNAPKSIQGGIFTPAQALVGVGGDFPGGIGRRPHQDLRHQFWYLVFVPRLLQLPPSR